jgi:hypothetical protein
VPRAWDRMLSRLLLRKACGAERLSLYGKLGQRNQLKPPSLSSARLTRSTVLSYAAHGILAA